MAETLAAQPRALPAARRSLDHLAAFRVTYLSVFAFMLLYIVSVEGAEALLQDHFERAVRSAVSVSPVDGPVGPQINNRVSELLATSRWITLGGVRVAVTVLGANGQTPLYVGAGKMVPPPPAPTLEHAMREAAELLPAISDVFVSVSHGSLLSTGIFVMYAAVLLQGLFFYNRARSRREADRLEAAITARDDAASRAGSIERELLAVRGRLRDVEPAETAQAEAIRSLRRERAALQDKLRELAEREASLRQTAARAIDLEQERQALEDLLDEALEDLGTKEGEIQTLQDRLKNAPQVAAPKAKGRGREDERIARRLRTLYKGIDVDDRAIEDLAALGDDSLKLRCEEAIKRLAEDPDTAAVRRKVGGLPPQLSIYEIGFAGKGRIYYLRADTGRYRVLAIGGKATQKSDLEYLSRLA
jgi:uncharacterized protein YjiS (DUF1127 family)/plasmid stabilization system protein ParE